MLPNNGTIVLKHTNGTCCIAKHSHIVTFAHAKCLASSDWNRHQECTIKHVHIRMLLLDLMCIAMQIVQNQEHEAAEMAEQIQELEGDRQQLQVANEDLDLAEDRVSPLA